ncbi:cutinase family protein [Actinomadura sp. B10D3]|uniref:cutinase family protein n=1 Tax=Actinomadura sp. B10D3 TaxID=3153557 RepID=UPI00325CD89A
MNNRIKSALASLGAALTLAALVPALPGTALAAKPRPAGILADDPVPLPCDKPYVTWGLRGSGQPQDGSMHMGSQASPYAEVAWENLPQDRSLMISLPYPASAVGPDYLRSLGVGIDMLTEDVRALVRDCPDSRIGLIGYSQGAHVVSSVLVGLTRQEREHIHAVLLLADPAAGGDTFYDQSVGISGGAAVRSGAGVLARRALPPDVQSKVVDFCIQRDTICDSPEDKGLAWAIEAGVFGLPIHSSYANCCGGILFREILGLDFAERLLAPQQAGPAQCGPPGARRAGTRPRPPVSGTTVIARGADRRGGPTSLLDALAGRGCGGPTGTA